PEAESNDSALIVVASSPNTTLDFDAWRVVAIPHDQVAGCHVRRHPRSYGSCVWDEAHRPQAGADVAPCVREQGHGRARDDDPLSAAVGGSTDLAGLRVARTFR